MAIDYTELPEDDWSTLRDNIAWDYYVRGMESEDIIAKHNENRKLAIKALKIVIQRPGIYDPRPNR